MKDLFKEVHSNENKTLIPIVELNEKLEKEFGMSSQQEHIRMLKKEIPHLVNDIYFIPNQLLYHFVYYKDNVYVQIVTLEWEVFKTLKQKEIIEQQIKLMKKIEKKSNYVDLFTFMEKPILFKRYIELFYEIPNHLKYTIFRNIWRRSEYGFQAFSKELLDEIFQYKDLSVERNEGMKELENVLKGKNIVTIYRGITDESTPLDKAISWTIDEEVAERFAKRFSSVGYVFKAEIEKKYIIDFITQRSEEEVIIDPSKIQNVELYK